MYSYKKSVQVFPKRHESLQECIINIDAIPKLEATNFRGVNEDNTATTFYNTKVEMT